MNPCANCPCKKEKNEVIAIEGRGNKEHPNIFFLAMNPGEIETRENKVLVGPSGRLLTTSLENLGITNYYMDNAVSCWTKIGTKLDKHIDACRERVTTTIVAVRPKLLVLLGLTAVKSIFPNNKDSLAFLRQKIHKFKDFNVIVTYHPSAILRSGGMQSETYSRFIADLKWAKQLSEGSVEIINTPVNYKIIEEKEDLVQSMEYLSKYPKLALDFETNSKLSGTLFHDKVVPLTVAFSGKEGESLVIPLAHPESKFINDLPWTYSLIASYLKNISLIAHNGTFENIVLHRFFDKDIKVKDDTLLMSYVLQELPPHDLHSLTNTYTNIASHKKDYLEHRNIENDKMPLPYLAQANLADSDSTFRLYNKFRLMMDSDDQAFYENYLVSKFSDLVGHMQEQGMTLDKDYIRELMPYTIGKQNLYEKVAKELWDININSSDQLAKVMLELGYILPHTDKMAHSTNKEAIEKTKKYTSEEKKIILDFIEKHREYKYINKYYLSKIFDIMGDDGKVHSNYKLFGTVSGRLACSNLNMQNIAKNTTIQKMFIPSNPDGYFVNFDYSNHEFRYYALLNNDRDLMTAFRSGMDIHSLNAALIFNKAVKDISKEERFTAKTCNPVGTKVLTAKLEWKNIEDLAISEELLAFDETNSHLPGTHGGRQNAKKYRISKILDKAIFEEECVEFTLSNGDKVQSTLDHQWLVYSKSAYNKLTKSNHSSSYTWHTSKDILTYLAKKSPGFKRQIHLSKFFDVWEVNNNYLYEYGWLGGFMDGEGTIKLRPGIDLRISQNPGLVSTYCETILNNLGVKFSKYLDRRGGQGKYKDHIIERFYLRGRNWEMLKILGLVQSKRLIEKFIQDIKKGRTPILQRKETPYIIGVKRVGIKKVVALKTTTKTYIAEGYGQHNCSFGSLYGAGIDTLSKQLNVSSEKAKEIKKIFDYRYPSIKHYYNWIQREYEKGYYASPFGRKYHDNNLSFAAKVNTHIQGSANYLVLLAGWQLLQKGFNIVNSVHDSLCVEFDRKPTSNDLNEIYQTCINVELPGYPESRGYWDGELSIGKSLGEMVPI